MTKTVTIGRREFQIGKRPYIMGILNVTPDSFSDGGRYADTDRALRRVEEMIAQGADIIDVGGESTRPNAVPVSAQEEMERSCFVIEAIRENFEIPISLDTYKSEVAQAGIAAGADMINDIWGFAFDDRMARLVAKHKKVCCLTHNRKQAVYGDFLPEVLADLRGSVELAKAAGVAEENIILDPGIGFAKDTAQCLFLMNHLEELLALGYPVLLGTSNKSMIGNTLKLPVEERTEGTIATSVFGWLKGCAFFRVHDVRANVRALAMACAMTEAMEL